MRNTLLLLLTLTAGLLMAQHNYGLATHVRVADGTLEGLLDTRSGVEAYLGIPYAKPPVGALRWAPPRAAEGWDGVRSATHFGPRAVQAPVFGDMSFRSAGMSEDCLYLNVWTPDSRSEERLPVLVYFYGGGFVAGDGSEPRYDGERMAAEGIVAVTVNYRLNIFGFFAHPDLSAESDYGASGNYGLLDQQFALRWVHDNIAAFGGDPDRITIAGESAGSVSVSIQMASPLSRDLIAGAIGESGAGIEPTLAPVPLAEAERGGKAFADELGFHSINELRKLSTAELYRLYHDSGRFGFPIVVDGHLIPKTLPELFAAGEQAQVPLLVGWNSAEIPGAAFLLGQSYTPDNFVAKVRATYPERHEEVLALYAHDSEHDVERSATDLASDRFIVYSTWRWFDLHRRHSDRPVYRYLFSRIRPPLKDRNLTTGLAGGTVERTADDPGPPPPIGAPHASEIEYCMGNLHLVDDFAWTPTDYAVSKTMMGFFANFIKTGDPNGPNVPEWPSAAGDGDAPPVMTIDAASKANPAQHDDRYEFLSTTYPQG